MRFLNGCIYKAMLFYKMENELNQFEKELLCGLFVRIQVRSHCLD